MKFSWIALIALPAICSGGSVHPARPLGVSLLQTKGLRASEQRAPESDSQETDDAEDTQEDQEDTSKKDDKDSTSTSEVAKKDDQDDMSTGEVAKFGPSDCFTAWRNKDGQCEIQTKCKGLDIDTYLVKMICVEENGEMVRHVFGTGSFDQEEQFNTLIKCEKCLADKETDIGNVTDTLAQLLTEVKELKDEVKSGAGKVVELNAKVFGTTNTTTTTSSTSATTTTPAPVLLVHAHAKQAHRRASVQHMRPQRDTGGMATAESVAEEKAVGAVTGKQHARHFMVSLSQTARRSQELRSRHRRSAPRHEADAGRDDASSDESTPQAAAGIAFSTGAADRSRGAEVGGADVDSAAQETDIVQDGEAEAQAGSEEESAGADSTEDAQDGESQQASDEQQGSGEQQGSSEQQADSDDKQADVVDERPAEEEEDDGQDQ